MEALSWTINQINFYRIRIPKDNSPSIAGCLNFSKILLVFNPKFVHASNPGRKQCGFKKTINIHFFFFHEADDLMLFQGTIKTLDIPTIDDHQRVGEVGGLLPLSFDLWLRFLVPLLVVTPEEVPEKSLHWLCPQIWLENLQELLHRSFLHFRWVEHWKVHHQRFPPLLPH
jgi:hypothetical protein